MTHPEAVEGLQDGRTTVVNAAPQLAAMQHNYEGARAFIAGLVGSSRDPAQHDAEPHPDTEAIDIRLVKPPAACEATPPTAAMSVAARFLAEQPIIEGICSRVDPTGPTPQRHTTTCHEGQEAHIQTEAPGESHRPRRWWHAVRASLPRAVPAPR